MQFLHGYVMQRTKSVVVLPPYWFDSETVEYKSFQDRIADLEKLRDTITDEIGYLRTLIREIQ